MQSNEPPCVSHDFVQDSVECDYWVGGKGAARGCEAEQSEDKLLFSPVQQHTTRKLHRV